jgi:uncharacterized Ntn-hydrolase superfamily protein
MSAPQAMEKLTSEDEGSPERQCGMVDAHGRAATFTGPDCMPWAGGVLGDGFCCQGNILVGQDVVEAMAHAFETGSTPFSHRLISALEAGQAAGGDSRGKESAALLIVRKRGGYGGNNDRYIDLRVDDHPDPIVELRRILRLHEIYFGHGAASLVSLDPERIALAQSQLRRLGDLAGDHTGLDAGTRTALERFIGRENLEERSFDGNQIDSVILDFLTLRSDEAAERDAAGP